MKTFIAMALFCAAAQAAAAETIVLDGTKSRTTVVSKVKLTGSMKTSFGFFKKNADFFGAFYINPAEDVVGGFWNTTSPGLADEYARKSCAAKSRTPSACQLYARVEPKTPAKAAGRHLSQSGNLSWAAYRQRQASGTYGAFAWNENGDIGFSWAGATEQGARDTALKLCRKDAAETNAAASALIRDKVLDPAKSACRVLHVTHPGG